MTVTKKMLSGLSRFALIAAVGVGIAQPPVFAERLEKDGKESDDANLRREAFNTWYNEAGHGRKMSTAYMRFLNAAAARERAKYQHLLPDATTATSGTTGSATLLMASVATGTSWINLGPTKADVEKNGSSTLYASDSGRPVAIVPDPTPGSQTVYVAMAGGGVWKTTDGGASWSSLTDSLGSLSCGALAMDPNDSITLYLGLGDAFDGTGIGLVKSTNGGASWTAPVYLGDSTIINSIAVTPTNGSIVLVATNKGLYRSTDAGLTFSAVSLGTLVKPYTWTIASGGGTNFALSLEANHDATSGTTGGQVWTSADNGATWTPASGMTKTTGVGRIFVASAPSNRSIMYAEAAVPNATSSSDLADFFKSSDGGHSWIAQNATARKKRYTNTNTESTSPSTILNGQGWYNQLVIVHPTNPSIVYFGGALLMAKTTDGGSTYTQISNWLKQFSLPYVHADFHAGAFDAAGNMYVGTDGGVFKSTDAGVTFADKNAGIVSHLIYSVGSSRANTDAVIGGFQDNGTRVRYVDPVAGATSTFNQYIGGDGFGSNIHDTNAQLMLGSLYYTRIYKSTNGGTSFASSSSGITESNNSSSAPFITKIIPGSGDTVYTFVNAKVYKSTNYGGSWSALGTSGLPTSGLYIRNFNVASANASVMGIVANSGRVFLSNTAGASWTQVTATPNNGLSMSYVFFDVVDPSTVYVASVAASATKNHLWKSTNFGASWTVIEGSAPNNLPAGVPVNTIVSDPINNTTLYAGTHLGVYTSTDGGLNWTRFGAGMPLVNVTDLYIAADSSLMRASTFGRGFWQLQ